MDNATKKNAHRAARYDSHDVQNEIKKLILQGCEVGVHGVDAWRDPEMGRKEYNKLYEATEQPEMGIRIHWLYFNDQSAKILEEAGFSYDSTLGYNDTAGYRSGTVQIFRPPVLHKLLELPLNVQDTALFYPDRMGLTEEEAWQLMNALLENADRYGGVVTVNWHDRSLAPERLWRETYVKFLEKIKMSNSWIGTASNITRWFDKRRSAIFENVFFFQDSVKLQITCNTIDDVPDLMVRVYSPNKQKLMRLGSSIVQKRYHDIHFTGTLHTECPINIAS
jgi:hypothetical protein